MILFLFQSICMIISKMSDRLKDLPDLVFKKIFRFSDIKTQSNLYEAYDTDEDREILNIIKGQKAQAISNNRCSSITSTRSNTAPTGENASRNEFGIL